MHGLRMSTCRSAVIYFRPRIMMARVVVDESGLMRTTSYIIYGLDRALEVRGLG